LSLGQEKHHVMLGGYPPGANFALRNAHGKVGVEQRTWQKFGRTTHMAKFALNNAHGKVCVEQRTWQSLRRTTHMAKFAQNNAHGKVCVEQRAAWVQTSRDETQGANQP
jgi:hypothetical protein